MAGPNTIDGKNAGAADAAARAAREEARALGAEGEEAFRAALEEAEIPEDSVAAEALRRERAGALRQDPLGRLASADLPEQDAKAVSDMAHALLIGAGLRPDRRSYDHVLDRGSTALGRALSADPATREEVLSAVHDLVVRKAGDVEADIKALDDAVGGLLEAMRTGEASAVAEARLAIKWADMLLLRDWMAIDAFEPVLDEAKRLDSDRVRDVAMLVRQVGEASAEASSRALTTTSHAAESLPPDWMIWRLDEAYDAADAHALAKVFGDLEAAARGMEARFRRHAAAYDEAQPNGNSANFRALAGMKEARRDLAELLRVTDPARRSSPMRLHEELHQDLRERVGRLLEDSRLPGSE